MSKKSKRREAKAAAPGATAASDPGAAAPPARESTPSTLPGPLAFLFAALTLIGGGILLVVFLMSIPDAAARAREGITRAAESACSALRPEPHNVKLGALPATAPDFQLKDYAGREVKLSELRGNIVLVNFWATWCQTCVVEMPSMERLVSRMKGKPFRLLAVSVDDAWPQIRKFFARGTSLEVLLDTERKTPKAYGTDKFPESFIIDRDGTIRYYVVSNRDWGTSDVAECIEGLLQ